MIGVNKVILIGNVGSTPEMRYTPNGTPVTTFSLACNSKITMADGTIKTQTDWFRITAFKQKANICNQYVQKGKPLYIEGQIHLREYTDAKDGIKHTIIEVVADVIRFLDSQKKQEDGESVQTENAIQP